ncbi:MAG: aldehyde dehydrogenase family protein [Microscillaceae bacterium]|nr:aldehyde dehydrogenase family protein [Microscillaceae bacterium]
MTQTIIASPDISSLEKEVDQIFEAQKKYSQDLKNTSAQERITKLRILKKTILSYREDIHQAVYADFKKSSAEADLGEIFGVLTSISHTIKHLRRWMRPKRIPTPLNMLGTSSQVYFEPKGLSLIISPWNYPFQLAIDPLVYAIAAGCTTILKPSELTPNTSALMKKMLLEIFPENEVAVFEGDAQVAQALLKRPFDHIFFTGSPQLGKIIMEAASKHLTSVTLELGGKSPAIVDESANLKDAAQKIIWGKYMNCGQTCIAPDYVMVQESVKDDLVMEMKTALRQLYGENNPQNSPDYTRIVNQRHFKRIKNLLDDALAKGAEILEGGQSDEEDRYIAPTLLTGVNHDMAITEEEIFGPLLPIIPFKSLQEATTYINTKPKPLALYTFSRKKNNQEYIIRNTSAGGTAINETLAHISNPDLPFGGVNHSGIGKTHGYYGFVAFSNERAVLRQRIGWTTLKMLYPPYTDKKKKTIDTFSKFI